MYRFCALAVFVVGLFIWGVNARSQEKEEPNTGKSNVQVLMRDKLSHMQGVLDGLVTNDFQKIGEEAEMLRMLGRAASWQAIDTEEYRTYSSRYGQLTAKLAQAAQGKNQDAALLQYLQLNVSCVDCHQYIREHQEAENPSLGLIIE